MEEPMWHVMLIAPGDYPGSHGIADENTRTGF